MNKLLNKLLIFSCAMILFSVSLLLLTTHVTHADTYTFGPTNYFPSVKGRPLSDTPNVTVSNYVPWQQANGSHLDAQASNMRIFFVTKGNSAKATWFKSFAIDQNQLLEVDFYYKCANDPTDKAGNPLGRGLHARVTVDGLRNNISRDISTNSSTGCPGGGTNTIFFPASELKHSTRYPNLGYVDYKLELINDRSADNIGSHDSRDIFGYFATNTFGYMTAKEQDNPNAYPYSDNYNGHQPRFSRSGPYSIGTPIALLAAPGSAAYNTYKFEIKNDCDNKNSNSVRLRWYDADYDRDSINPPTAGNQDYPLKLLFNNSLIADKNGTGGAATVGGDDSYRDKLWSASSTQTNTWEWDFVDKNNGMQLWLPYSPITVVPELNCTDWNLKGNSTVKATAAPGDTVNFNHYITNNGPDTATYDWALSGAGITNANRPRGSATTPNRGINPNPSRFAFKIPSNARNGQTYCQHIYYTHPDGPDDTSTGQSNDACVTVQSGPPPTSGNASVSSSCTWTSVNDPGNYNVTIRNGNYPGYGNVGALNNKFKTRTHIWISGVDNSVTNALIPFGSIKSHTWNYIPITPDIGIVIAQRAVNPSFPNDASKDFDWISVNGNPDIYGMNRFEVLHCYVPSCTLTVFGDGPGGIVTKGGTAHVRGSITNAASAEAAMPDAINGGHLSLTTDNPDGSATPHNTAGGIWPGLTAPVNFDVPANGSVSNQSIVAQTDYWWSAGRMGAKCSVSFSVYEPFVLGPSARVDPAPDEENPATINYSTKVSNSASVPVSAPSSSAFYKLPAGGGQNNLASLNGGVYYPGNDPRNSWNGSYNVPSVQAGDQYCAVIFLPGYTTGYVGPGGPNDIVGASNPGQGGPSCFIVNNKPYFKVLGANARAGGTFVGGTCSGGGILASWYKRSGGSHYGADVQLSTIATVAITGLASGAGAPPASNNPADAGLSFANTPSSMITDSSDSPTLGGNYGSSHCIRGEDPPDTVVAEAGTNAQPGNLDGAHKYSTDKLTLNGGTISPGKNLAIFANGDVYINGNITYGGGWDLGNVPSFVLRAGGNIYIAPGVTQLDGLYIAQPDGKIYTCANASGFAPTSASDMYDNCKNRLTVYGSFIAKQINLMRTFGSLRNAQANAQPCSNAGSAGPAQTANCAAEVFRFSPEMYLSSPAVKPPSNGATRFDAYTSLPPVL